MERSGPELDSLLQNTDIVSNRFSDRLIRCTDDGGIVAILSLGVILVCIDILIFRFRGHAPVVFFLAICSSVT